eukprot:CAMPEP_0114533848 /NCGR_PEP_ID=MMETSP0109-20121206/27486_1 /TAXON_ID=29199 /ORGANISM="Chlorarachnion reptans, Strain CCCM449" /LENGTH=115 /DNA_ID=CAMNT_0001717143 /DNA_START=187 /DNA_END=534 /DNA_ORIENTATION=-
MSATPPSGSATATKNYPVGEYVAEYRVDAKGGSFTKLFTVEVKEGGEVKCSDFMEGCCMYEGGEGTWKMTESGPEFQVEHIEITMKEGNLLYKGTYRDYHEGRKSFVQGNISRLP